MPLLSQATKELTIHVFDPIIRQLVHRLLDSLSYTDVIGDQIYINTDWSTHSKTSDINNDALLGQQAFRVEANIQLNPTSQKFDFYTFHHTTAYGIGNRTLNNTVPVYLDLDNRVRIIEMRSPVTIVLNCELILKSPELAFQTPQQIFNGHENGAVFNFNDLAYDYPIPKPILSVLYGIWKMDRLKGKPAGKKFYDYLMENSNQGWQVHKHREKEQYEIVVPVFDLQTLSTLEYSDDRPNGVMEDKLPVGFSIPFIYTVQFALPTLSILQFPPVINNQLVPERYIPTDKTSRFNNMPEYRHGRAHELYKKAYGNKFSRYLQTPEYDEWTVPDNAPVKSTGQTPILILGLLVEEDEPDYKTMIDLSQDIDPTFALKDVVKEILYQQGEESLEADSIYNVALYKEDRQLVPYKDYTFNEDLQLTFKAADLFSHYHAVVSVATDINKINPKWYPLLKQYFPLLNDTLRYQIGNAVENGTWKEPNLPDNIYLGPNGWIYDEKGTPLIHITDTTAPYNKGLNNAYHPASRIFRNIIIPRKTSKFTAGSSGQTPRS